MNDDTLPFVPQDRLGRYCLHSAIARGGMGEIWRGHDPENDQPVAIKRLFVDPGHEHAEALVARLVREAQAIQRLEHEHVVRYLDSGVDDNGQPFLVLEWLEGESLVQRLRRAPISLAEALEICRQTLAGLQACHAQQVVHRDLKPGNLLLVPEGEGFRVKLVDFGLALLGGDATRLTQAGQVMGTLYYLSPEQARGAPDVDHRADLYSVGVILYELCTGRLPFTGDEAMAVLLKIIAERPPRPRQVRPELPPWLEQVILRAMERAPSARYASAAELQAALTPGEGRSALAAVVEPMQAAQAGAAATALVTSSMEHRLVALLCAQAVDPQDDAVAAQVEAAVLEAGGICFRLLGGQLAGCFGLDRSLGDEASRAVRAGLAVRQPLQRRVRLSAAMVHVEVREGLQLNTGDLERTVQELPRLPPGELVLDEAVRQLVAQRVELTRVGTHHAAVAETSEPPSRRRVLGVETPTIGRETELAGLRAAFYRAADNEEPEAALLIGPPGMGKSRLADELRPELADRCALLLEARGAPARARTPHGLLAEALTRRARARVGQTPEKRLEALQTLVARFVPEEERPEVTPFLAEVAGIPAVESAALLAARSDPQLMRERITRAFAALLEGAGRRGTVALLLDDLQWADDESLQLCEHVLERADRSPIFLLGTARLELDERRPELFTSLDPLRLELRSLGKRPMRRLVRAVLGSKVSRQLEDLVVAWSDGNPYFAEELLTWMVQKELLVLGDGGWEPVRNLASLQLPAGVEATVQSRLDRLEPPLKELTKAAATFGETLWQGGCEALGFSDAAEQLPQLEAAELIVSQRTSRIAGTREWCFRHALLQQVAYGLQAAEVRRPAHLRAARWLEEVGETDPTVLAHHFDSGGDPVRAADYRARAGARALAEGDLDFAAQCYRSALSVDLAPGDRVERSLGLARTYILCGRYDDARQVVEPLDAGAAEAPHRAAEILFTLGRVQRGGGDYRDAEATLERATGRLGAAGHLDLRYEIDHARFWTIWLQGRYKNAGAVAKELRRAAVADKRPDHLCSANLASAYFHVVEGDLSASVTLSEEALEQARDLGHPFREVDAQILLGSSLELVGQHERAAAALRDAGALATRLNTTYHLANIEIGLSRIGLVLGDHDAALERSRQAAERGVALGDKRTQIIALCTEATLLCQRQQSDDLERAGAAARRAAELASNLTAPLVAEAQMVLARTLLCRGDAAPALSAAEAAVAALDELGAQERCEVEILLTSRDALAACGRADDAAAQLARAHELLQRRAERISDEGIRQSFLTQVPHNRRVLELFRE